MGVPCPCVASTQQKWTAVTHTIMFNWYCISAPIGECIEFSNLSHLLLLILSTWVCHVPALPHTTKMDSRSRTYLLVLIFIAYPLRLESVLSLLCSHWWHVIIVHVLHTVHDRYHVSFTTLTGVFWCLLITKHCYVICCAWYFEHDLYICYIALNSMDYSAVTGYLMVISHWLFWWLYILVIFLLLHWYCIA